MASSTEHDACQLKRELVYQKLRDLIAGKYFQPGDKLPTVTSSDAQSFSVVGLIAHGGHVEVVDITGAIRRVMTGTSSPS